MKRSKTVVLVGVISLQIVFILFLAIKLHRKHTIVDRVSMQPVKKSFVADNSLRYFYELSANASLSGMIPWPEYYTINKDGLNERFDYDAEKKQGVFRIIMLGDSWTFGFNNHTKDTYSEQLEDLLKERCETIATYEVINLGLYGYDLDYMREAFSRKGKKYAPDVVVILIKDDDILVPNELTQPIMDRVGIMTEKDTSSVNRQEKLSRELDAFYKEYGKENIIAYEIKALEQLVIDAKGKVVFSLLDIDIPLQKKIAPIAKKHGVPTVFLDRPLPEHVLQDGHPNKKGHKQVADALYDFLKKEGVVCR